MLCEFFSKLLKSFASCCCMLACNFRCRTTYELALSSFHTLTRLLWSGFGEPLVQSLCILHIPQPQPDTEDGVNLGNEFSTSIVSLLSPFSAFFFGDISIIFTKDCLFSLVPTQKYKPYSAGHSMQYSQRDYYRETALQREKPGTSGHMRCHQAYRW